MRALLLSIPFPFSLNFVVDALEDIVVSVDVSRLTTLAGLGVKLFVYYITITIPLNTIGFSTAVLILPEQWWVDC